MTREDIFQGSNPFSFDDYHAVVVLHCFNEKGDYIFEFFDDPSDDKSAYKIYKSLPNGSLEFVKQYWHCGSYNYDKVDYTAMEDDIFLNVNLELFNGASFISPDMLNFLKQQ